MGPKDFAISDYQCNCPGKLPLAGGRWAVQAVQGFAGAAAHPPLQKHPPWQQKVTLVVLKDQKFLNLIQINSHTRKD